MLRIRPKLFHAQGHAGALTVMRFAASNLYASQMEINIICASAFCIYLMSRTQHVKNESIGALISHNAQVRYMAELISIHDRTDFKSTKATEVTLTPKAISRAGSRGCS